jgi:hypothetical protein
MMFAGEGAWRWRMMQPASDRTYEYFWRQAARWLAASSPDPVTVSTPDAAEPGDVVDIRVEARDGAFAPVGDAAVSATLTPPTGAARPVTFRREAGAAGRFVAAFSPDDKGLYRVQAEAVRGQTSLGRADRWFYVGGADRELADPRLNEGTLRRLARDSGGQYLAASDASRAIAALEAAAPANAEPDRRDLWHEPWAFALVVILLSIEWVLRRRWGLR